MSGIRKNIIKKLDTVWSNKVRTRDGLICRKCGEYGDAPHHIFKRDYMATRFDIRNGIILCIKCHVPFAHEKEEEFTAWVIDEIGTDLYEKLRQQSLILKVDINEAEIKLREGWHGR